MWVWHSGDMPRSTNVVRSVWPQKRQPGSVARAVSELAASTLTLAFIPLLSVMRPGRPLGPVHADLVTDHKLSAVRASVHRSHNLGAVGGAELPRPRAMGVAGPAKCIDAALQHERRLDRRRRLSRP